MRNFKVCKLRRLFVRSNRTGQPANGTPIWAVVSNQKSEHHGVLDRL